MNLFKKRKYVPLDINRAHNENDMEPLIPDGLWVQCPSCGKTIYKKEIGEYKLCTQCGGCFRMGAWERIALVADSQSFVETNANITSKNPMDYPRYDKKIAETMNSTGLNEAVVTGTCTIYGYETVFCVMDSRFIMGSMGSVVGEKITRAFELALEKRLPIVVFTASGGARMQEGIISLMQMAKVSAAVARHSDAGLLYVTVLTDPTTGGVTASFAMLGDIILSEPKALIGFAGRRVIEQTLKQTLPADFQTAEFLLHHGFVDQIVNRKDMKKTLSLILAMHKQGGVTHG